MSGKILFTIKNQGYGRGNYVIFFTSTRAIAAKTGGSFLKDLATLSGSTGFLLSEKMQSESKSEELSKLIPESILSSEKNNFEIHYTEISMVKVKKPGFATFFASEIHIHTEKKKYVFKEQGASKEIIGKLQEFIKTTLPDKYTEK